MKLFQSRPVSLAPAEIFGKTPWSPLKIALRHDNQAGAYAPTWKTYANHSAAGRQKQAAGKTGPTLFD
jgi:hypothetical protein